MITDSFLDIPLDNDQWLKELQIGSRLVAAYFTETLSILPIMLQFGYRYAVIANEQSANVGNLKLNLEKQSTISG